MERRRARGKWTRLGDISWIKVPETPAPAELYWQCEECGIVEPYPNPLGHWQRRSCACQRRVKHEVEEMRQHTAWLAEQRNYTYGGWLGKQWIDPAVVRQLNSYRFENYDESRFPAAYKKALEFALRPQGNLIFHGWYGVGKTHLEAAIANYLREASNPVGCLFTTAPQFFMAYDDARCCEGPSDHHSLVRRAISAAVLIIDDVDKYRHTEAREDLYYAIIDERYKAWKPTILSVNDIDRLPNYIGNAACSRLSRGLISIKMVEGTDYRQEQM